MNLADKIVTRPVASLVPYASNARTHTPAQIDLIARSISAFGFTNPILVDGEKGIIAGHARFQAAQKLRLPEVPTIELSWLTPAERQAYVIADNQTAIAGSGWDAEMLRLELGDLKELGFDLSLTGFGEFELGTLLADKTEGLTDPDDAPAVPTHPVTQSGDLWLLGRHRLLCGDSTSAADVERLLAGAAPHLMVTDPPYGVNYDPAWRNEAAEGKIGQKKSTRAVGQVANDDRADWRDAWALFLGTVAYVWHAGTKAGIVQDSLDACGFEARAQIVWAKNNFAIGRGHYHCKHEPCWYMVRKGSAGAWSGDRTQTTLWQIDKQPEIRDRARHTEAGRVHEAPDREQLLAGTGGLRAVQRLRHHDHRSRDDRARLLAIEISPAYVDVAVKRWEEFSGKRATLAGDGRSFDQIAAERVAQQPQRPMPIRRERRDSRCCYTIFRIPVDALDLVGADRHQSPAIALFLQVIAALLVTRNRLRRQGSASSGMMR